MGLLDKKNKKSRAQARRNASGKGPSKPEEPEPSLSQREEEELRAKIRAQMFGDQLKEKIMAKMDEARFGEMQPEDEKPKDESEPETSKTDPIQENEQGNHLGKNAAEQFVSHPDHEQSSSGLSHYSERDNSVTDDGKSYAKPSIEQANEPERSQSRADFSLSYRFPSFNKDSDPFEDRASSSTPSGVYKHSPFDDRYALSKDDYSSQTEVLDEYSRVCPDLECDEIEHVDPEATPTKKLFQVPLPSSPSNRADPRAPSSSHFRRPTIEQHISDTLSGFRAIGSISQGQEKATQIPSPNRFTKPLRRPPWGRPRTL
ncbi:hypothetical protein AOQ84DRAFT_72417 [Glonium stellatum]|uniref:Uncharacterized protein n=1 Tax=Glonium stellatum TaxID=574774 RepID=A0A8E2FBL9_9PEZI|nr:hypothetical protein AOQ84DRAFT_72417 [Glonium stellatum]